MKIWDTMQLSTRTVKSHLFERNRNGINGYLLTYLLTQCSRVLLEKLTSLQLIKKFPTFYGTQRFITAPVHILSQLNPVHTPTSHFLKIHLNIILLSIPGSPQWSHSPTQATCPVHLILDFITRTIVGEQYRSLSSSL
jgi:hypothetical protein